VNLNYYLEELEQVVHVKRWYKQISGYEACLWSVGRLPYKDLPSSMFTLVLNQCYGQLSYVK